MTKPKNNFQSAPIEQPETFSEAMELIRTLGDVKDGYRYYQAAMRKEDLCKPCALAHIDLHKVADLIEKYVQEIESKSRKKERRRIFKNICL